jgi:hypothetical protein
VNYSGESKNITADVLNTAEDKLVDEVKLMIRYKSRVPQMDVSFGSLIISDTRNLHGPQAEAESKVSIA